MFDIGFSELFVIGIVALIVIGPERLPKVARTAGHLFGRMQRYVNDVKADINREMELDELRKMKTQFESAAREVETSSAASAAVAATLPASAASEVALQAGAASAAAPLASAPTPLVETVHSVPAEAANPVVAASGAASAQPLGVLAVRVSESSWIEVQDGGGQILLSRTVQPGESIGLDGALPLRLKIGNAAATQLSFRGQAVDLGAATQGNVARLELK